ncbi:MAG: T9SS C-terminal target domain-containing protein [bacterium TMED46]|nr:MAG: T9SS C-terminal target domain-containing protein [bacterium TMED46]
MKKLIFFLGFITAQTVYEGEITFDYEGTEDGTFSSIIQDSIVSAFSFNQTTGDTSYLLLASITQQEDDEFDLFLAILTDTTFPVGPRTWDIPGEGDEDNPLSLETIVVFMPGLDSTFVLDLFDSVTDTSSTNDSSDVISDIFSSLTNDLYLGLQGEVEITESTDTSIIGVFNTVMIKPAFYFPPHTISIDNGEFIFNEVSLPALSISNDLQPLRTNILQEVYPNPFNSSIVIEFFIEEGPRDISLSIFDINGRNLETLFSGPIAPGAKSVRWDSGQNSSGIYFVVLETEHYVDSKKLILVK